jgi:hypothetical protein
MRESTARRVRAHKNNFGTVSRGHFRPSISIERINMAWLQIC